MLKLWERIEEEVGDVTGEAMVGGVGVHTKSLSYTGRALYHCDLLRGGPTGTLLVEAEEEELVVEDEEGLGYVGSKE